jgi:hypothetical protein
MKKEKKDKKSLCSCYIEEGRRKGRQVESKEDLKE